MLSWSELQSFVLINFTSCEQAYLVGDMLENNIFSILELGCTLDNIVHPVSANIEIFLQ